MKLFLRLFIGLAILGAAWYFNESGLFRKVLEWVETMGPFAPVVFLAVYILTCVFFFPSMVFTFASGVLFGLWLGAGLSLVGNGIGSVCALLLGRYLARDKVSAVFGNKKEFRQMDEAIRRKGWKIILLARLSPIFPFLVGNYALGLTAISPPAYFFATVAGSIPSTTVYAYLGTLTGDVASLNLQDGARTPQEWALLIFGLIATVLLAAYLRKVATEALSKELPNS